MLVLRGRRPLRPAPCCVHGVRAQISQERQARDQSSSMSRPERFTPFGPFAFQGVRMTTKLSAVARRSSRWCAAVAGGRAAGQRPVGRHRPRQQRRARNPVPLRAVRLGLERQGLVLQRRRQDDVDERHAPERHADAQLRRARHQARGDAEGRPARRPVLARHARRAVPVHAPSASRRSTAGETKIPSIAGLWNVQVGKSSKGEAAWQLIVRQAGAEVSAVILRIDGDTGTLTGTYPRRHVRAQPFLGRAAAAARADAGLPTARSRSCRTPTSR